MTNLVQNIWIDASGELLCPTCGSRNLSYRRTRRAKLTGVVTVGVGVVALPKRIQCIACREYFKSPAVPAPQVPAAEAPHVTNTAPAVTLQALNMDEGDIEVYIDDGEWIGAARLSMLRSARPGLTSQQYAQITNLMLERKPAPVGRLTAEGATALVARLEEHGFTAHAEGPEPSSQEISAGSAPAEPVDDVVSQLERLASLRDRGVLTDDEFAQQKAKLLG